MEQVDYFLHHSQALKGKESQEIEQVKVTLKR